MVNRRPPRVRRSAEVDEASLGTYLAGASSHRIRKALTPLLGEKHLSKSAVSRLRDHFARWSERDLSEERYAILFLDGFHLKVRLARKVVSVLVLAALGVAADSTKTSVARPAPPHAEPERRRLIEHERRLAAIAVEFVASSADRSAARICALWVG